MPYVKDEKSADISVILPTYNRLEMLREALESALSQTFKGNIEIIVVDDNSQDGTSEIVKEQYPSVSLISLKQNVGAYAARNLALKQSHGRYIAFLDSDDLWEPEYLSSQIKALDNQNKSFSISSLVSWYLSTDYRDIKSQEPKLKKYTSALHHLLAGGSFIFTPTSVVFPRQIFDEVGCFDETLRVAGDTDFYVRCILSGYQPIFTGKPLAIRRMHNQGQLTGVGNIEIRKAGRLERAKKYHPLVSEAVDIVPLSRIYAEIHTYFSSRYFQERYLGNWIATSISAAKYDPSLAVTTLFSDVRDAVKYKMNKQ